MAQNPLRVLVSPLDWGLGHATRVIPLIRALITFGARVDIAASGSTFTLLRQAFPALEILELTGYPVRYARSGTWFLPFLASQVPGLIRVVREEKAWLQREISLRRWDLIISDNRYGLHHPEAYTVLLTHQVHPRAGSAMVPNGLLSRLHRAWLKPFDAVWVADQPAPDDLAGKLSHPLPKGINARYIGHLSQLTTPVQPLPSGLRPGTFLLVLLSGPEPQRSLLEAKVLEGLDQVELPVVLVRGLPVSTESISARDRLTVIDFADDRLVASLLTYARGIICRSGYTSLMDLRKIRRTALLVPTPGQGEQEFLAKYLASRRDFSTLSQQAFSLSTAWSILQQEEKSAPTASAPEGQESVDRLHILLEETCREIREKRKGGGK